MQYVSFKYNIITFIFIIAIALHSTPEKVFEPENLLNLKLSRKETIPAHLKHDIRIVDFSTWPSWLDDKKELFI